MSNRELVVLGTASQAPTRYRNHNGYLLRWDGEGILFDPGEGTQRQMILAGVSAPSINRICITHFHGDHCLGLPGVIQRMSLDGVTSPVDVHFPASGQEYLDRLRTAAIFDDRTQLAPRPLDGESASYAVGALRLSGLRLDHSAESVGWRLEEPDGIQMVPERLERAGIRGPEVGRLQRDGRLATAAGEVTLAQMSEPRRGQKFAFIMDTRLCDAAFELAADADLVVCESTFLTADAALADSYAHLTAAQAARIAAEAGARRLVLTHFSQRYGDDHAHLQEAAAVFPEVIAARDLDVVPLPPRR